MNDIELVNRIPGVSKMLEVICRSTGMGFAAVARVTDTAWLACAVRDEISFGLKPGEELKLETTICNEIRQHQNPVVINHVSADPQFAKHHTPEMYGFQSYISVPILLKSGAFFGTLCAIDPKPAQLDNTKIRGMFDLFTDLLSLHISNIHELNSAQTALRDEQHIANLREQFIAILGHDLRNPVHSILNGTQLLEKNVHDPTNQQVVKLIQSSAYRINGLVDNMLDFASGRLGGGIALNRLPTLLQPVLTHVINEFKSIDTSRVITTNFKLSDPVLVDPQRIAQSFSNLLGNALKFGDPETAVEVSASTSDGHLQISVTNYGTPIPDEIQPLLFKPFVRGKVLPHQNGLGLGLFIASEIARAHGGELTMQSCNGKTLFTLSA